MGGCRRVMASRMASCDVYYIASLFSAVFKTLNLYLSYHEPWFVIIKPWFVIIKPFRAIWI
jgi:hypothetical protein